MTLVLCFAVVSLLGAFPLGLSLLHWSWWASLLFALGVFVLLHALWLVFFLLAGCTVPNDKPMRKPNRLCRFAIGLMAETANFYMGVRPVVTGIEKLPTDGRFLYVCNHRSAYDPLVVIDRLRKYQISFISKPSNLKLPFVGRVAYAVGFLPIDRENDRKALTTILTAADYLKQDFCSIGVYPEGTRSKTEEMLPFHAGCFKTAQKANVPIVVASVHGSEKVKRAKLLSSTRVYLDILEVIPAETVRAMRTAELSEKVRGMIQADLDRAKAQEARECPKLENAEVNA